MAFVLWKWYFLHFKVHITQLWYANISHPGLTCIEESFGTVIMLPGTGDMQRRAIVAVMGLHYSSLINHELNTIGITLGKN